MKLGNDTKQRANAPTTQTSYKALSSSIGTKNVLHRDKNTKPTSENLSFTLISW